MRKQQIQDRERGRARELLRVIDGEDERLDQQQLEVAHQVLRHRVRIERLDRAGQSFSVVLGSARKLRTHTLHQPRQEPAGGAVGWGNRQPYRRPPPLGQRLLERRGLPEPGVRNQDHRPLFEPVRQSPDQVRALDPNLCDREHARPRQT